MKTGNKALVIDAAYTSGHRYNTSARTYQGTVGMGRSYGGSSNNRGGLVGGADPGTYKP